MQHEQHEWETSETQVLHERHQCDMSAKPQKKIDFDNDTSENIFSHPYIYYMAGKRL